MTPSAVFDCPDDASAQQIGEAMKVWGAEWATIDGAKVTIGCGSAESFAVIMNLCNDGAIEELREGKGAAEIVRRLAPGALAWAGVDPGEGRG